MYLSLERKRRLALVASVFLVILYYGVGYVQSSERPNDSPAHATAGWKGWWDQGSYYRSVAALEKDNFDPAEHHYPVGYPLLSRPFYPLLPEHPFFLPDLVCYITIALAFTGICQRIVSPMESLLLCFFSLIVPVAVRTNLIRPWTNTPVSAALVVLAFLAIVGRRDRLAGVVTGICASVIFTIRPGDFIYSWPVMTALWFGWQGWRDAGKRLSWFLLGAFPLTIVALYFNVAIHGSFVSAAYLHAAGIIGFGFASLGLKLYTLLIDGSPLFPESRTLVTAFPALLFVLPGIVVFLKEFRWRAAVILATQAGAVVYFLAFNDFWISNVFRAGSIRYWLWMVPFWFLFAYLTLRFACRRLGWIATGGLVLLPILVWIFPQMSVRSVGSMVITPKSGAGGWSCIPAPNLSCNLALSLDRPVEFDVLKLRGVPSLNLTYATAWVDNRPSPMFHDIYISDYPDGQTYVIFFALQRGKCIRLSVPTLGFGPQSFALTSFQPAIRHEGLALRNPFHRFRSR